MNGSLDMNNNRLVNLSAGIDDNDAVTKSQLDSHTSNSQIYYHLRPSFNFYKDFADFSQLQASNPPNVASAHFFDSHNEHANGHIIEKEGWHIGFGGQAWTSITSETISDSAECYAGLSVRFESSAACM